MISPNFQASRFVYQIPVVGVVESDQNDVDFSFRFAVLVLSVLFCFFWEAVFKTATLALILEPPNNIAADTLYNSA